MIKNQKDLDEDSFDNEDALIENQKNSEEDTQTGY